MATFAGCSLTGTAGSGYSLSAASSGLTGATSSPTFALATGSATKLVFTTSPGNSTNGVAFSAQPVVKVEDSGGNVVTSLVRLRLAQPLVGRAELHHEPPQRLVGRGHLRRLFPHRHGRLRLQPERRLDAG